MKENVSKKKLGKMGITLISLSATLLASLTIFFSVSIGDIHGKDGTDGKDANIIVGKDGELIVNDNKTGIFANKDDYQVTLKTEGEEYGRVVGGGRFAKGDTVTIQAIPYEGACFKGWKDINNNIVSLDSKYTFVADSGKLELTGVFEKSLIEVYLKISDICYSYFDDFVLEINGEEKALVDKKDNYGSLYYELENPSIFEYGDTVTLNFLNFVPPSFQYNCYLSEVDENTYNGKGKNRTEYDITQQLSYTFSILENRPYYFAFDISLNIFVEILPAINVSVNDAEYGTYTMTECKNIGDHITLKAIVSNSNTLDYIYEFKGWYLDNNLVTSNETYSFNANEYEYNFEARFVKKYALKVFIAISDYVSGLEDRDPTEYIVSYKSIDVYSNNNKGETNTVSFKGNYNGESPDLTKKICGYFEVGEMIYLSSNLENSHESYYVIHEVTKDKDYYEKFVFTRWYIKGKTDYISFSSSSSGTIMFNDKMDILNADIKIELFVKHTGDKLGG